LARVRRTVAAILTAVLVLTSPANLAAADPPTTPASYAGHRGAPKGAAVADTVVCGQSFTPVPQYSSSGGRYGTVHWGAHLACVGVPGWGHFAEFLYTIRGNGDNQSYFEVQSEGWSGITGSDGNSWFTACLGNAPTRWIAKIYSEYDNNPYTPYPAWSPVYTLPCD
jgi:hypothetical protein